MIAHNEKYIPRASTHELYGLPLYEFMQRELDRMMAGFMLPANFLDYARPLWYGSAWAHIEARKRHIEYWRKSFDMAVIPELAIAPAFETPKTEQYTARVVVKKRDGLERADTLKTCGKSRFTKSGSGSV